MKTRPGYIVAILLAVCLSAGSLSAGDAGRESQFSLGAGVRALGMGGAFVGMADDASAVYWNQAGLAFLEYQQVELMHATLFEGTIYDVANYVYPDPKLGGFGLSFMRLGTGDIIRRSDWIEEDKFSYSIMQMILGYGREIGGGLAIGTALKIVNQSMADNSTYGYGMDLSILKPLTDNITAGVNFQNIIQPRLRLGSESETTPYTIMTGLGIRDLLSFGSMRYDFNLAMEIYEDRAARFHFGGEAIYHNINLRAGYDRDNFTFGFGVIHKRLRLDYAFRLMDGISDSHRFGFSLTFGSSVSDKINKETEYRNVRGRNMIIDDRQRQFIYYRDLADRFNRDNQYDSALVFYQRALAYDENNESVLASIEAINKIRLSAEGFETSDDNLRISLLDGLYEQATDFYVKNQYIPALGLVEKGLMAAPTDIRFIELKNNLNAAISEQIADLLNLARRAEREDRLSDAITLYNKMLELSPDDLTAGKNLSRTAETIELARAVSHGVELFYRAEYPEARRSFEEVLRADRLNIVAREYLDKIKQLTRKPGELEDIKNDEAIWRIYLNALQSYQNGDFRKAVELWEEVLEKYPGNSETLENIRQAGLRLQSQK